MVGYRTGDGLGYGFAHLRCLVVHAGLAAQVNELTATENRVRWEKCALCGIGFRGSVGTAMARHCWKTYADRPNDDENRLLALYRLGWNLALSGAVQEASLILEAIFRLTILKRALVEFLDFENLCMVVAKCYDLSGHVIDVEVIHKVFEYRSRLGYDGIKKFDAKWEKWTRCYTTPLSEVRS